MQRKALMKWQGMAVLAAALAAGSAAASDTVAPSPAPSADPLPAYLINVPPEAQAIAPALRRVLQVAQSSAGLEHSIRQLRADLDAVKTKLASANGEAELLDQQRQQLVQELSVLERATRDRIEALRKDLEAKLEAELAQGLGRFPARRRLRPARGARRKTDSRGPPGLVAASRARPARGCPRTSGTAW